VGSFLGEARCLRAPNAFLAPLRLPVLSLPIAAAKRCLCARCKIPYFILSGMARGDPWIHGQYMAVETHNQLLRWRDSAEFGTWL
jgi:hypothetical protein